MIEIPFYRTIVFVAATGHTRLLLRNWLALRKPEKSWAADTQFLAALTWTMEPRYRNGVQPILFYARFRSIEDYALFKLWYPEFQPLQPTTPA